MNFHIETFQQNNTKTLSSTNTLPVDPPKSQDGLFSVRIPLVVSHNFNRWARSPSADLPSVAYLSSRASAYGNAYLVHPIRALLSINCDLGWTSRRLAIVPPEPPTDLFAPHTFFSYDSTHLLASCSTASCLPTRYFAIITAQKKMGIRLPLSCLDDKGSQLTSVALL